MIPHLSYSQYNTYTSCPREWYLSKIRKAEEKQTWFIPIGSAVHQLVELHLDGDHRDPRDVFYPLIEKQMLIEPDTTKWLAGGSKDDPCVEGKALQRVKDCFNKALEFLDGLDVWEVEYAINHALPGMEVPIIAYIDIIGEHKKHGPTILDWKTGSTKPGNFQLETYAALLKTKPLTGLPRQYRGRYVMLSPTYTSIPRPVDLSKVDPVVVGMKYQRVYNQMKAKLYAANQGFNCKFCFHQENCNVNAGKNDRTDYYDRSSDDGFPF